MEFLNKTVERYKRQDRKEECATLEGGCVITNKEIKALGKYLGKRVRATTVSLRYNFETGPDNWPDAIPVVGCSREKIENALGVFFRSYDPAESFSGRLRKIECDSVTIGDKKFH